MRPRRRMNWQRLALVTAGAALVLAPACVVLMRENNLAPSPSAAPAPSPAAQTPPTVTSASNFFAGRNSYDDSGYVAVTYMVLQLERQSFSLAHDRYYHAGYRGAQAVEKYLAGRSLTEREQFDSLQERLRFYLYEGDFAKAAPLLETMREMVDSDSSGRLQKHLREVLFLQGVTALRRGETENCVECNCQGSCIFPIQPQAVHQKPAGSRQAVRYFTEFLSHFPDDVGARWLLNLAYMTLGEYPQAVPPEYLIPLSSFQSEFDVGRFRDIAPQLGLNRLNMSGGAIMDDFDNDGLLDLVTSTFDEGASMKLYRNRGDGTFEDRTRAAGLDKQMGGLYCVQTDYNNDGWLDIYVCRGGWREPQRHSLLRNNGDGTFTDVTEAAGLTAPIASQVACWADYDNDGYLDLFVGSEPVMVRGKTIPGRSRLYHNRGNGTFEEVAVAAGVANPGQRCKGASWGDFDGDGYPDLLVSIMGGSPHLYHNNRDGTFTDVAAQVGITKPEKGFSCWSWDYDNDGWLDLFVTSNDFSLDDVIRSHLGLPFEVETCRLYRNLGGQRFQDVTAEVGLELAMCPMGSNFLDVDNDGFLDFYLATGGANYSTLVPNRLFKNVQGKHFADITLSSGTGHLQKGHAVASGDLFRDGNVDLFVELGGPTPGDRYHNALFQNPGGHGNHWLTVKLIGKKTNRAAIGARIKAVVPGPAPNTFYRHVTSGSSFGANPLEQTIGIGKATKIDTLEVSWPTSGRTQVFRDVAVDQALEIEEFSASYRRLNWKPIPRPR